MGIGADIYENFYLHKQKNIPSDVKLVCAGPYARDRHQIKQIDKGFYKDR